MNERRDTSMSQEKFEPGQPDIVAGDNGVPDRPGIVQSHVAQSVFVQYTDRREPLSEWRGQSRVRAVERGLAAPQRVQTSLFDTDWHTEESIEEREEEPYGEQPT